MKVIATWVTAWVRKWWVVISTTLAITLAVVAYVLRPTKDPDPARSDALDAARKRADDKIAAANARAAVEITVARTKDSQAREQLQAILDDEDEARRGAALIAMGERMKRE